MNLFLLNFKWTSLVNNYGTNFCNILKRCTGERVNYVNTPHVICLWVLKSSQILPTFYFINNILAFSEKCWSSCQGKNIHGEEIKSLPELDWHQHQRYFFNARLTKRLKWLALSLTSINSILINTSLNSFQSGWISPPGYRSLQESWFFSCG